MDNFYIWYWPNCHLQLEFCPVKRFPLTAFVDPLKEYSRCTKDKTRYASKVMRNGIVIYVSSNLNTERFP